MKRVVMTLAVLSLFTALFAGSAFAAAKPKDFPTRPITFVVPFPPGGSSGLMGNKIAEIAPDYLGQPLNLVFRAGVGGLTATAEFMHAKKDGYSVLLTANALFTVQPFMRDVKYSLNDYRILCGLNQEPQCVVVKYDAPYNRDSGHSRFRRDLAGRLPSGAAGQGQPCPGYGAESLLHRRPYQHADAPFGCSPTGQFRARVLPGRVLRSGAVRPDHDLQHQQRQPGQGPALRHAGPACFVHRHGPHQRHGPADLRRYGSFAGYQHYSCHGRAFRHY
ncbi:exported hypothetical protein [uncultured delta proteobacterium]|uniref:Tripartite tricarboxylate transporter family receptor n=1 Tax=uncultured delta proteobacterium TaxID=34034 RepID=A0A212JMT3_9DELT|nr:exported hypothetical protein [uncultured delta proteobacterium]